MSTTLKRREMFIGGKWGPGTGREYQEIVNPATGKVIAEVPKGTEEDVNTAVRAARDAYDDVWFDTTPRERSERLLQLAEVITLHAEELARIESEAHDLRGDPADRRLLPVFRRRRAPA